MKNLIVELAERHFAVPKTKIDFTGHAEADKLLGDLKHHPHAFVLACLMDQQIRAEKSWITPYEVFSEIGASDIKTLSKIKEERYVKIFNRKNLHRFNNKMALVFYNGIIKIKQDYEGNAALIWSRKPSSATIVNRFLEFKGAGPKIATMAANILARRYKIPFSDYYALDISPDIHVRRIMERLGYVSKNADKVQVINKARELNPEFPGIIDSLLWEIGKEYCRPTNPDCKACIICKACKKVF
jgi:endonuclease III